MTQNDVLQENSVWDIKWRTFGSKWQHLPEKIIRGTRRLDNDTIICQLTVISGENCVEGRRHEYCFLGHLQDLYLKLLSATYLRQSWNWLQKTNSIWVSFLWATQGTFRCGTRWKNLKSITSILMVNSWSTALLQDLNSAIWNDCDYTDYISKCFFPRNTSQNQGTVFSCRIPRTHWFTSGSPHHWRNGSQTHGRNLHRDLAPSEERVNESSINCHQRSSSSETLKNSEALQRYDAAVPGQSMGGWIF